MAHISWNSFMEKHSRRASFGAAVSGKLPNGPHFDKNKKKLPTPYGLFQEWLSVSLTGDWSSTKVPGGFVVCVVDAADAKLIATAVGITGTTVRTNACDRTHQLLYRDSNYADLARKLGYAL